MTNKIKLENMPQILTVFKKTSIKLITFEDLRIISENLAK